MDLSLEARLTGDLHEASSNVPHREKQVEWYHPGTLAELELLWKVLSDQADPGVRQLHRMVFFSILNKVSSQDQHWGWICDNVKPKCFVYRDAIGAWAAALASLVHRLERDEQRSAEAAHGKGSVVAIDQEDALTGLQRLQTGSVDALITSPPYLGTIDYIPSQRLALLWLEGDWWVRGRGDEALPEYRSWRELEIGARFKRYRQSAAQEYIDALAAIFQEGRRVLRPGGYLTLLIGESKSRAETIEPLLTVLQSNFEIVDRSERVISNRRLLIPKIETEQLIVLK